MSFSIITSSSSTFQTVRSPNLSTPKSNLYPSSNLCFNTHFPKSNFNFKKASISNPINSVMADSVYVETESFYKLLGITENVSISDIKKAYKHLVRKYHPDVSPPELKEEYTKMFIKVQEAYQTLSDPKTRASYDRDLDFESFDLNVFL